MAKAVSLHITGVVQGVGFRPFVYNLAGRHGVSGWVLNSSEGVFTHIEGDADAVDAFVRDISGEAPPMAVIDAVDLSEAEPEGFASFDIRASRAVEGEMTLVSPDIATCEKCRSELMDEADRRHRYAFTNCTNCGPRFTIIADIPYDRPMTTMRDFPMCEECATEYEDPADRRFHAQPNACHRCGPRLFLNPSTPEWEWRPELDTSPRPHHEPAEARARDDAIIAAAVEALRGGRIVAVKGLGGFQLACDATDEAAVRRLRERKHRWGKPLAVMVANLDAARLLCRIGEEEASLLAGTARPIVLLHRLDDTPGGLADSVAGLLPDLGLMLPYTPLHHLLLAGAGNPLVMTSGNLSEEPIAMDNAEALERLGGIADLFLMHDRGIYSRYDDSVARVRDGVVEPIRRARGYAPYPLGLPFTADVDVFAAGPEQKNTFCLTKGDRAFVSQHIGDMENVETLEHYERTLELYSRLFRIEPGLVAYDLHPEYLSTKFAKELDLPRIGVQHHHAHVAGVSAEHGVSDPVVGIAFDGTGYGEDGHIWGGEVLISRWDGYERFGHLAEVPLPGGASAIRRPARMAIGTLAGLDPDLLEHEGALPLRGRLAEDEERILLEMIERGVNSPPTSSMGRLFDAVAALAGVRDDARYEGQAAIELEAVADMGSDGAYRFEIVDGTTVVADPTPVVRAVLDDVAAGRHAGTVSARFHRAVADMIVEMGRRAARAAGVTHVAMAGGVFMNRLVLSAAWDGLESAGLKPLTHVALPANDGGIAYGQAVVAYHRRSEL
jgi:hydrogenase maturation protein HypF